MESDMMAVYNTPLLVNALRFIRNRRLPPGDVYSGGESPLVQFNFAGLCVKDIGPFKEAESVWAAQSLLDGGGDGKWQECGSTFAGPLHMLVVVDGVTVEHWKLEDYREEHTENSFARTQEHLVKLHDIARILYTYLCCGDVYGAIERKASELLAGAFAPAEGAGSQDEEESPLSSSIQRSSLVASCTTMASTTASTVLPQPFNKITGTGRLAFHGTELLVVGPEGTEGCTLLQERGLLHKLNAEAPVHTSPGGRSQFEQHHWYVDELISISVIRDTFYGTAATSSGGNTDETKLPIGAAAHSGEEGHPQVAVPALHAAAPAAVVQKEEEEEATTAHGPEEQTQHTEPQPSKVEGTAAAASHTSVSPVTPETSDSRTASRGDAHRPAHVDANLQDKGVDAGVARQALPLARRNPVPGPLSAMTSPALLPSNSDGSSPTTSQVRRRVSPAPAWAGELTRHSAALSGSAQSGTFARLRAREEKDEADCTELSAMDLYTICLRFSRAGDVPLESLTDLLAPLRQP